VKGGHQWISLTGKVYVFIDHGSYNNFKKVTGIGFSPYIYHAIQHNFTDDFGGESGISIPSVFVISVQWSFR